MQCRKSIIGFVIVVSHASAILTNVFIRLDVRQLKCVKFL